VGTRCAWVRHHLEALIAAYTRQGHSALVVDVWSTIIMKTDATLKKTN